MSINNYLFEYIQILNLNIFCNVRFEFSWLYKTKQSSEILILEIEMLLESQNEMNINYWVLINAFWIRFDLSNIDMWDIDLSDTDLDF